MTKSNAELLALSPEERQQIALREKMATWPAKDVVAAWYRSDPPFELTKLEDEIRQRWDSVRAHFLAFDTWGEIVTALQAEV